MRFENLAAFLEVAKRQSMTLASEYLFTTPQNISKLVRELENDLGNKLLIRQKGNMILTPEGEIAVEVLSRILDEYARLKCIVSENRIDKEKERNIKILLNYAALESMGEFLNKILLAIPNICIEFVETDIRRIFSKDDSKVCEFDYLFFWCQMETFQKIRDKFEEQFDIYILERERMYVYMNKQSIFAQKNTISFKQLEQMPLVGFASALDEVGSTYEIFKTTENVKLKVIGGSNNIKNWEAYLKSNRAYVLSVPSIMRNIKSTMGEELVKVSLKNKLFCELIMCVRKKPRDANIDQKLQELIKYNHRKIEKIE